MTTTNGTKAIKKSEQAIKTYITCFLNMDWTVKKLKKAETDLVVLCSGRDGGFSLEDTVCAGMIVHFLKKDNPQIILNDAANAASELYWQHRKNIKKLLFSSVHGQYLYKLGMEEDINACAQTDSYKILPVYKNGFIVEDR